MPVLPHVGTSQLICCVNQLTGFYMRATLAFNGLNALASYKPPHLCISKAVKPICYLKSYSLVNCLLFTS